MTTNGASHYENLSKFCNYMWRPRPFLKSYNVPKYVKILSDNSYLILCKNDYRFYEDIRRIRNQCKEGFIQQGEISPEMHDKHMKEYSKCYYLCALYEYNEDLTEECVQIAGYCGVIEDDIRVATHPSLQGMGIGKFMINSLIEMHPSSFAKIKLDNEASIKLFESCGFKKKYYILERL